MQLAGHLRRARSSLGQRRAASACRCATRCMGIDVTDGRLQRSSLNGQPRPNSTTSSPTAARARCSAQRRSPSSATRPPRTAQPRGRPASRAAQPRGPASSSTSGQAQLDLDAAVASSSTGKLQHRTKACSTSASSDAPSAGRRRHGACAARRSRGSTHGGTACCQGRPSARRVINVAINLGQRLSRCAAMAWTARLRGELKLTPGRQPVRPPSPAAVSTSGGGQYAAYGQKLDSGARRDHLQSARFDNPAAGRAGRSVPTLDIARRRAPWAGTALSTACQALYSDPDMADTDKLSWLLLGRGPGWPGPHRHRAAATRRAGPAQRRRRRPDRQGAAQPGVGRAVAGAKR